MTLMMIPSYLCTSVTLFLLLLGASCSSDTIGAGTPWPTGSLEGDVGLRTEGMTDPRDLRLDEGTSSPDAALPEADTSPDASPLMPCGEVPKSDRRSWAQTYGDRYNRSSSDWCGPALGRPRWEHLFKMQAPGVTPYLKDAPGVGVVVVSEEGGLYVWTSRAQGFEKDAIWSIDAKGLVEWTWSPPKDGQQETQIATLIVNAAGHLMWARGQHMITLDSSGVVVAQRMLDVDIKGPLSRGEGDALYWLDAAGGVHATGTRGSWRGDLGQGILPTKLVEGAGKVFVLDERRTTLFALDPSTGTVVAHQNLEHLLEPKGTSYRLESSTPLIMTPSELTVTLTDSTTRGDITLSIDPQNLQILDVTPHKTSTMTSAARLNYLAYSAREGSLVALKHSQSLGYGGGTKPWQWQELKFQVSPQARLVVDAQGDVYFGAQDVESGGASILKWRPGAPFEVVATFGSSTKRVRPRALGPAGLVVEALRQSNGQNSSSLILLEAISPETP